MYKLPHIEVYVRLRPSSIHGIGCFAILDIPAGTELFPDSSGEMAWIPKKVINGLPPEIAKLYKDFAVEVKDLFGCPRNFNSMDPSWYLNNSETPNAFCDPKREYSFYTLRDIKDGEEITVNYKEYAYL